MVEIYSFISERLLFYVLGKRRYLTKKVSYQEHLSLQTQEEIKYTYFERLF